MPYGYKLQFGVQRVTEPDPNRRPKGRFAMTVIVGLAVIILCLLIFPLRPTTAATEPAAHIQPAARATPTAAPNPSTVRFTCQMVKTP